MFDQAAVEGLMRQGKWDDAAAVCKEALRALPTNAKVQAYHGLCLFQKQDWAGAASAFQKATALQPDFWQAGAKYAQCLERMQRYGEALEVAKQFARLQPNDITLQGLVRYLTPMVHTRTEGWERTAHLGFDVRLASDK